jgi:hypothetical protein
MRGGSAQGNWKRAACGLDGAQLTNVGRGRTGEARGAVNERLVAARQRSFGGAE